MGYANAKNIPFVALVGENEMNENKVTLKNMETGEQTLVSAEELIQTLNRNASPHAPGGHWRPDSGSG